MTGGRAHFLNTVDVSRETMERLDAYAALLAKWTRRINLVSPATLPSLWHRHILDSAQLLRYLPEGATKWVDLGSGGGFPGAVVAILAAEAAPNLSVTLIEADQRKAAFLRAVSRETSTEFDVVSQRIEAATPQGADILSARALASISDLLPFVERHLSSDGIALLQKGATWNAELSIALEAWRFRWKKHESVTDKEAVILELGGIERV